MKPQDENNFLIEVTPEQLEELRKIYRYVDGEGYEVLHYSPYWKEMRNYPAKNRPKPSEREDAIE